MTEQPDLGRPRRVGDAVVHRVEGGAVLWWDDPRDAVRLNPTALALWELCDGNTTVDEMVTAVCALFAVEPDRARDEVRTALSDMREAGMLR